MRRRPGQHRFAAAAIGLAVVAVSLVGGAAATAKAPSAAAGRKGPKPTIVSVADFYFGPDKATIKKGGAVKWVWASTNTEPHDVHLKKGPKGLKKPGTYSTKTTAVTNAEFKKKFETPGTYHFICTIHPTKMKLTVTVKK
jgi:plastocyanin